MNRRMVRPWPDALVAPHAPANASRRCALSGAARLALLAALLFGPNALNAQEAKPEDSPFYARVEVYGIYQIPDLPGGPMHVIVPARPKHRAYPLDVSKLKGWTDKKWMKLNGEEVHVTGTLEYQVVLVRRGVKEERLVIVVDRLQVADQDFPKRTGR
jgi:hypothetical protein